MTMRAAPVCSYPLLFSPVIALLLALSLPAAAQTVAGPARVAFVVGVIDGDSYRVSLEGQIVTVRLAGSDTPERGQRARCDQERDLAERATARAAELIGGRTVDLRPLPQADRYGRLLASITVDGLDVATALIREGLAVEYHGRGVRADWCGGGR